MNERESRNERLLGLTRVAAVACLVLGAGTAEARPVIPGELQKIIGMPCAPPCTICHQTNLGGRGTATKPFAGDMILHGFTVDPPNTAEAVANMRLDNPDADGDGVDDITELKEGTDPNDPTKGASVCGPTYGCVRVARGPVDGVASVFAGLTLASGIALLRRRARRS